MTSNAQKPTILRFESVKRVLLLTVQLTVTERSEEYRPCGKYIPQLTHELTANRLFWQRTLKQTEIV